MDDLGSDGAGHRQLRSGLKGKAGSANSQADGVCLNSSAWLDGVQVMDEGKLVHRELAKLAHQLGKQ